MRKPDPLKRKFAVVDGDDSDRCPLCGILRRHAGYLRESCGDGFMETGCFVVAIPAPPAERPEVKAVGA